MIRPYLGYHSLVSPYFIQYLPLFANRKLGITTAQNWFGTTVNPSRNSPNRVQLIWVPDHEGIVGKETANQMAKLGFEFPFIGQKPAFSISVGVAKKVIGKSAETIKKTFGILNRTHTRILCQKNGGTIKTNQKPVTVGEQDCLQDTHLKGRLFKIRMTDLFVKGA